MWRYQNIAGYKYVVGSTADEHAVRATVVLTKRVTGAHACAAKEPHLQLGTAAMGALRGQSGCSALQHTVRQALDRFRGGALDVGAAHAHARCSIDQVQRMRQSWRRPPAYGGL